VSLPVDVASESTAVALAERSAWSVVRDAIRGSRAYDYTEGSLGRAVLLLAIPMVMEMIMESVFAVVDVFFVSRLGASAVAAVGLTESMLTIVYGVALGLSIGGTAVVARRTGEKDLDGASRAALQAIVLAMLVAVPFAVAGITAAPALLRTMGAAPDVIAGGAGYTRIMLGGNVVILLLFMMNAIFRGAGDAAIAMRVLWLGNIINCILDPCLILGLGPFPALGVTGAAVATTTGRGTAVCFQIYTLWRGSSRLQLARRHLRLDPRTVWTIVRLSATGTLQTLIGMTSWVAVIRIFAVFGSAALAGFTISMRVIMFALLPAWGMANAAATMVGQNLGAGKPDRAERAVWTAGFYNLIFLGSVGALFVIFPGAVIGIFTHDPDIARYGAAGLRIVSCGFVFYAYGMVLTQSFNGAGDAWTPTLVNVCCFWLFELPVAFLLSRTRMGTTGVFIAMVITFSMLAVVSGALFRLGRWKTRRV
jgi:MATE family, multidrug efflux pump